MSKAEFRNELLNEELDKVTGGAGTEGYEVRDRIMLYLMDAGVRKRGAIAAVKELMRVGTKEAEEFLDSLPKFFGEYSTEEEALSAKRRLESAGCMVEIK